MKKKIEKKLWGVLGKQQTYFSPGKQFEGQNPEPLNSNPFESWDYKRSKYQRVDLVPNHIQQHGVVPQDTTPVPSPTPSITPTATLTPTPSITPTNTPTPSSTPAPPVDADAAAYLASVLSNGGTLDATLSAATDTLFTSLKSNGLYSKMVSFYPILGGVANAHKLNGNLNTTYDLTYFGGWTHNSSGQKPNGTNAYANTNYLVPLNPYSNSFGLYVSTSATTNSYEIDMGVQNGGDYWHLSVYWNATNDSRWFNIDRAGDYANTTNGGNYHNVRTAQNRVRIYRNGVEVDNDLINASNNKSSGIYTMYLGALNGGGTPNFYSTKNEVFSYIATGMTTGNTITLDGIINTFETSIGRNTY